MLEVMKLGGAFALLGLLLWAAWLEEWGDWFFYPACILSVAFVIWLIAYVVSTDGRERDVHNTQEAQHKGYGKQFNVPYTPEQFDENKFDHSHHEPGWFKRFWRSLWSWSWPRRR